MRSQGFPPFPSLPSSLHSLPPDRTPPPPPCGLALLAAVQRCRAGDSHLATPSTIPTPLFTPVRDARRHFPITCITSARHCHCHHNYCSLTHPQRRHRRCLRAFVGSHLPWWSPHLRGAPHQPASPVQVHQSGAVVAVGLGEGIACVRRLLQLACEHLCGAIKMVGWLGGWG